MVQDVRVCSTSCQNVSAPPDPGVKLTMIAQFKYLLFSETHLYSSDPWLGTPVLFVEHSDAQRASIKSREGISRLTFILQDKVCLLKVF